MQDLPTISVNRPLVVSETRDGESIIMHHGTGSFFDTDGTGAAIWQMIEQGDAFAAMVIALAERDGVDLRAAEIALSGFLDTLRAHDLIRTDIPAASAQGLVPGGVAPPVLELRVHTDLADMLLLDPIHDVDAAGWPVAPAA